MTAPVSIIVLSYNTRELALDCLGRFAVAAGESGWQVILVDNGSSDGTANVVQHDFPSVEVIQSGTNRGYAAGNNLGLHRATGRTVIMLNSDVQVGVEQLTALVTYLKAQPGVGMVSAGLRTPNGAPQAYAYGGEPTPSYLLRRGIRRILARKPLNDWAVTTPQDVDWVSGACLAVSRPALAEVGLLDERFFLYFEDVDWCLRMREAGWRVVYQPQITVTHLGGASEPGRSEASRYYYDSLVAFYRKHYGPLWAATVMLLVKAYRPGYAHEARAASSDTTG